MSPGTISNLNKQVYGRIEKWRNRKIEGKFAYVYLDGISLERSRRGDQVVGVENGSREITPIYGELYSQNANDFISENEEIIKAIRKISRVTDKRDVWVIDRGAYCLI